MRIKLLSAVVFGAILTVGSAAMNIARAQTVTTAGAEHRAAAAEHRKEMHERLQAMTPHQRKHALARAKHHRANHRRNLSPAQHAWETARRAEAKAERAAVKAGTLTRDAAAAQLRAWRAAHPRPAKSL